MFDIIPTASASHCKIFSLRVHRFYFYVLFPPSLSFFIYIYIYFLSYLSSILSLLSIDCAMLDLQISFLFFLSFLYIYKYTYIYIYIHTRQKVGQFKGWGEIVMQCLNHVQVSQCAFIKREAVWKEKKERQCNSLHFFLFHLLLINKKLYFRAVSQSRFSLHFCEFKKIWKDVKIKRTEVAAIILWPLRSPSLPFLLST